MFIIKYLDIVFFLRTVHSLKLKRHLKPFKTLIIQKIVEILLENLDFTAFERASCLHQVESMVGKQLTLTFFV